MATPGEQAANAREEEIRKRAKPHKLGLVRLRKREPPQVQAIDEGRYRLVEDDHPDRYIGGDEGMSLDEVEAYLDDLG